MVEQEKKARNSLQWILSYVAIFLLGFLLSPYQELYQVWIKAPDVSINFAMKTPYFYKTPISPPEKEEKEGAVEEKDKTYNGFFLRFGIKNESRLTTAKQCKVFLTGISYKNEAGEYIRKPNFEPIKLQVSKYGPFIYPHGQNVSPHQELYGYLGRIVELEYQKKYDKRRSVDDWDKHQFQILYDLQVPKWMETHLDKGLSRLQVSIYFGNHPPIHKTFEVNWTGEWYDDFEKMKKAISVKIM